MVSASQIDLARERDREGGTAMERAESLPKAGGEKSEQQSSPKQLTTSSRDAKHAPLCRRGK
jgi:hypothetical protein